jgi:NAD(P)H-dependent FMN reductase
VELFIPIIIGTARDGRRTESAARFVLGELDGRRDISTALVDVRDFPLTAMDNSEESPAAKKYIEIVARADGFIIVSPEYNHGYPGELKILLDMAFGQYERKPVAIAGAGGMMGGGRMTEQLRQVAIELGMVPIREAVYFFRVGTLFDESGTIQDASYAQRVAKMLDELVWYATALKRARQADPR